jgi:hypothetical protein
MSRISISRKSAFLAVALGLAALTTATLPAAAGSRDRLDHFVSKTIASQPLRRNEAGIHISIGGLSRR